MKNNKQFVAVYHSCYKEEESSYGYACRIYRADDPYLQDHPGMYQELGRGGYDHCEDLIDYFHSEMQGTSGNVSPVTMRSQISGKANTLIIPMNKDDFAVCLHRYHTGVKIQDAFPNLPAYLREFIKTGITPDEWNELFSGDEEE